MQLIFDPRFRKLVDFLSLESVDLEEPHVPEKIMFLYDWAERKSKSEDTDTVLNKLTELKKSIGTTLRGKTLLTDLYKWTRLDATKMLDKEQQTLDRQSVKEKEEAQKKIHESVQKREKDWRDTKDSLLRESMGKELANKQRVDIFSRVKKLEETKYKEADLKVEVVKDTTPQSVAVAI